MKFYNTLLEWAILPVGDLLNGSEFVRQLVKWRQIQYLSETELERLQAKKLSELLTHICTMIPYFQNIPLKKE